MPKGSKENIDELLLQVFGENNQFVQNKTCGGQLSLAIWI
jgi:hypothetical protein